jgi:hypothetical protein
MFIINVHKFKGKRDDRWGENPWRGGGCPVNKK